MKAEELYGRILGIESPWEISSVNLVESDSSIMVNLAHPSTTFFPCPNCGTLCGMYDHTSERTWRHLDTCQYHTYLKARIPRVKCASCGIHQIKTSWCVPNSRYTLLFSNYAAFYLQNSQVIARTAKQIGLSERQLSYLLRQRVDKGMLERCLLPEEGKYLAIDEKSHRKGHNYVTIIYSQHTGRVLAVSEDRTIESVKNAYKEALKGVAVAEVAAVSMDMWAAFATVTQELLPQAAIVHDRFHIASYLNDAVDTTRKKEHKKLMAQSNECLKKTKYLWLTNEENRSKKQQDIWDNLQNKKELLTYKAWELKEEFKEFFTTKTQETAQLFFNTWNNKVIQSGNQACIKVATMLKEHLPGLLSYPKHPISNAIAEGTNSIIQQIKAKARGFKSVKAFKYAILFYCGKLQPIPHNLS